VHEKSQEQGENEVAILAFESRYSDSTNQFHLPGFSLILPIFPEAVFESASRTSSRFLQCRESSSFILFKGKKSMIVYSH